MAFNFDIHELRTIEDINKVSSNPNDITNLEREIFIQALVDCYKVSAEFITKLRSNWKESTFDSLDWVDENDPNRNHMTYQGYQIPN